MTASERRQRVIDSLEQAKTNMVIFQIEHTDGKLYQEIEKQMLPNIDHLLERFKTITLLYL